MGSRIVVWVAVGVFVGAAAALVIPGLDLGLGLATGTAIGVALGADRVWGRRPARRSPEPTDERKSP